MIHFPFFFFLSLIYLGFLLQKSLFSEGIVFFFFFFFKLNVEFYEKFFFFFLHLSEEGSVSLERVNYKKMIRRSATHRAPKLKDIDAFRTVPIELSQPTLGGGIVTIIGSVVALCLMYFEFITMISTTEHTEILMDQSGGEFLTVNIDIEFFDLECKHLQIGIRDSFGSDRLEIGKSIKKTSIDHEGRRGLAYTQDEEYDLDKVKLSTSEQLEVDTDWISSSDNVGHDVYKLLESHDFTVILFYIRATRRNPDIRPCGACKLMRPQWDPFEDAVNNKYDSSLIRAVRINCADFERQCAELDIRRFPMIRLYKRLSSTKDYKAPPPGPVSMDVLLKMVELEIESEKSNGRFSKIHQYFPEGCRVQGALSVARVPGTLHFEAVPSREYHLNPSLTNISHVVHHLSFGDQGEWLATQRNKNSVPHSMVKYVATLDGQTFATQKFHEAPHHYMKVVSTRFQIVASGLYAVNTALPPVFSHQYSAQSRIASVGRHDPPSAKFSFDIAPVQVRVTQEHGRPWYDFLTSVMAIVGGVVSIGALLSKLFMKL